MTTFVYKAKKPNAETVSGQIHADNQDEAIDLISNLGLVPVTVELQVDKGKERKIRNSRISAKDTYLFTRQLSNLLRSGVGLLRSLVIIEEQITNLSFKRTINNLAQGIKQGRAFSECLADYPKTFPPIVITMVHAGEESGRLQEMLVNIAVYQQKQQELLSKVRSALAYPMLMFVVGILTVYFILTFTLPKMMGLFENMNKGLPFITQVLLNISIFLKKSWLWILIVLSLTALVFDWFRRTPKGAIFIHRLALKWPILGPFLLKAELARFCQTLVLLLKSGVSIVKALEVSIPVIHNKIIRDELSQCQQNLIAGGTFSDGLRASHYIPNMMAHLVTIGEESGNLCDVLAEVSTGFEQETDEQIKIFTTLFEPMMILIIGSVIGFIVFAMLLPIFQFDILAR